MANDDPGWPPGDEVSTVAINARNCLMYEHDRGPASLNVGTAKQPLHIPRSEAWQLAYAMHVLNDLGGDPGRVAAARVECVSRCVRADRRDGPFGRRELARCINLCDQVLRMAEGVTASRGEAGLALLVAVSKHDTMVVALGIVPGIAKDADRDLREAVRAAGARMSDIPSPGELAAWAFPWL